MTIQARYSGVCPECGERWQPGDLIRADGDGAWKHAVCPDDKLAASIRPGEVACQDCWLIHPEGECDR